MPNMMKRLIHIRPRYVLQFPLNLFVKPEAFFCPAKRAPNSFNLGHIVSAESEKDEFIYVLKVSQYIADTNLVDL